MEKGTEGTECMKSQRDAGSQWTDTFFKAVVVCMGGGIKRQMISNKVNA